MNRRLEHEIRDWLKAQQDGPDELAEQALVRALGQIGRRRPTAGFADRVLLRAGRLAPATAAWRWWWLRAAVAACLVAAGLAVALLPAWLPAARPVAHAFGSPFVTSLSHWAGTWLSAGLAFWAVMGDIGSAVRASLATPTAVLVLSANVLLAAASLLGLKRLLKAPEEFMPW